MDVLSCGEESMTIRLAVLIQCQRVTDRRTSSLYLLVVGEMGKRGQIDNFFVEVN